jgi:hypothetical protein
MKSKKKWNVSLLLNVLAMTVGGGVSETLTPVGAFASDVASWPSRALGTLTPMALAMAVVGVLVVAMGHSSVFAHEWAQRHEKAAFKGAIMGAGAAAICSFLKSIVS